MHFQKVVCTNREWFMVAPLSKYDPSPSPTLAPRWVRSFSAYRNSELSRARQIFVSSNGDLIFAFTPNVTDGRGVWPQMPLNL